MKLEAISHRATNNFCYMQDKDNLVINIKTGYDVEQVYIYHEDPYQSGILGGKEKWVGIKTQIISMKRLKYHLWWSITLQPQFKRCKYYFEIQNKEETWCFLEDGFYPKEQMNLEGKMMQYFIYPWMNEADINTTPKWVNDTIWYQIFPERFANGDPSINGKNVLPWQSEECKNEEIYGGDLQGIINKLDYLENLGITGLYLNPIFQAPSCHKYDTTDYMKIDPNFGDEFTLKELINKAHAKGMKVMLDGVFNHCGSTFLPWRDVLINGPESEYYDYFMINHWPFNQQEHSTRDGKFHSFAFLAGMPKLNTNNNEVIKYFLRVCEYWVKEFKIDGIRLDVANETSHKFNKALREKLKELNPQIYILGEIWHDAMKWLEGDEFDSVMNYPLISAIEDFWSDQKRNNEEFEFRMNDCYTMYMEQTNNILFNLLDSHDTNRLIHRVKNKDIFYQQLAVLFTMQGSPCIYYGTEVIMEGAHDPDCRRCMPWQKIKQGSFTNEINHMSQIIHMRKKYKSCKNSLIEFLYDFNNSRMIHYKKVSAKEEIQVYLNCSNESVTVGVDGLILFSIGFDKQTFLLRPNGTLIIKNSV